MPLKKYEELCRDETLVFCSGSDAPTLFRNLYKGLLAYKERDTPSMLLTMVHGKAYYNLTTPSIELLSPPPTEQPWEPTPVSSADKSRLTNCY